MQKNELIYTDESLDSIGTCSLDVNADSTDFSDTSCSSIFASSSSVQVHQQQLRRIHQSISQQKFHFTTEDFCEVEEGSSADKSMNSETRSQEKKPSYLNLACCVNGYSTLTNYDSIFRQNFHRTSREPSPVRYEITEAPQRTTNMSSIPNNGGIDTTDRSCMPPVNDTTKSLIQQRVERLYGVEAINRGFYSPKASKNPTNGTSPSQALQAEIKTTTRNGKDESFDLPVMRHLRPEFLAQLPARISPKKEAKSPTMYVNNSVSSEWDENGINNNHIKPSQNGQKTDETIHKENGKDSAAQKDKNGTELNGQTSQIAVENEDKKDGHYFLKVLKAEQARLLKLAETAEKYLEETSGNNDVSEEVLGYLRSASGKARLLVSKKMVQFEGLCHNSLNQSPDEKFRTTPEDLQGFWDMVYLQVDHLDSLFREIEELRLNNWQKNTPKDAPVKVPSGSKMTRRPIAKPKSTEKEQTGALSSAAQKREMQRKQLMELKKKNKLAMAAAQTPVEIIGNDDNI